MIISKKPSNKLTNTILTFTCFLARHTASLLHWCGCCLALHYGTSGPRPNGRSITQYDVSNARIELIHMGWKIVPFYDEHPMFQICLSIVLTALNMEVNMLSLKRFYVKVFRKLQYQYSLQSLILYVLDKQNILKLACFLSPKHHVFMTGGSSIQWTGFLIWSDRCEFCAVFLHHSNTTLNDRNAFQGKRTIQSYRLYL